MTALERQRLRRVIVNAEAHGFIGDFDRHYYADLTGTRDRTAIVSASDSGSGSDDDHGAAHGGGSGDGGTALFCGMAAMALVCTAVCTSKSSGADAAKVATVAKKSMTLGMQCAVMAMRAR